MNHPSMKRGSLQMEYATYIDGTILSHAKLRVSNRELRFNDNGI